MTGIVERGMRRVGQPGATFRHPWAFYAGMTGLTVGVLLHLPMYFGQRHDHYMLAGMPMDGWMIFGMSLMLVGYVLIFYGIAPRVGRRMHDAGRVEVRALDHVRLGPAHYKLMAALAVGVAIDTQKPFTFTFILPGVASEYNLRSPTHPAPGHLPVALFPFIAIVGTVVGSLVWGHLGDRIGRRPTILLAATVFVGTSMCGAMPQYWENLVACFFMGAGAGGLLPIAYSLLTEAIPAKRRGQVVVLVAGIGTAVGFLFASWTAHWLIPTFGWRMMWFLNIPTGLSLILLNRFIPESPRFLFSRGRREDALAVMARYGSVVTERPADEPEDAPGAGQGAEEPAGVSTLLRRPFRGITAALTIYGLSWGFANFGFIVWLPVQLTKNDISSGHVTAILAKAALFSIPSAVVMSWLYGRWSTRGVLILNAAMTVVPLAFFIFDSGGVAADNALLTVLLVILLVSLWGMISVIAPYAAEIYPTHIRAAGSGVIAGATKAGGVVALTMQVLGVGAVSLPAAALMAAVPAAVGGLMLLRVGIDTRGRGLEEIAAGLPAESPA